MRALPIAACAAMLWAGLAAAQETPSEPPKLLLTAQRLRRLQRDRERQTVRWTNFENRVNTVPDSPERGFELALYYAVTKDEKRGREAVEWALAHKCEMRQAALVLDWAGSLLSADEKGNLAKACPVTTRGNSTASLRDGLFHAVEEGASDDKIHADWKPIRADLQNGGWADPQTLYAACEFLSAARSAQRTDLRRDDVTFFSVLPSELLLSLKPEQVQHPDWMTHVAALALVALDPNLESSQFLQGWALEESQMLREGPGLAYEFLWADPYLPGIGYENLDPWVYDQNGRLYARSSWNADACWIALSAGPVQQQNCPTGWQNAPTQFGHLTLIPMQSACADVPHPLRNVDAAIVWKLPPHGKIFYRQGEKKDSIEADAAGLWRVPENVEGRVCTTLDKLKRP